MSQREPVVVNGEKVGRFKASWLLCKETWRFFRADSELLWVPVIAVFLNLALLAVILAVFILGTGMTFASETTTTGTQNILFVLATYIAGAFSFSLAQATIVNTVYVRIHGGNATLGDSLKKAFSLWFPLLMWSIITSTVGVVLQVVSERSKLLGKIIAALLGAAWAVLTYFVVTAMVVDKQSATASVKRSAQVFRSVWGETFISNISISLIFLAVHVGLLASLFGLGYVAVTVGSLAMAVALIILYFIVVLVVVLIQSVLNGILKTLLYVSASEGFVPESFNRELLSQVIARNAVPVSSVPIPPASSGTPVA